MPRYTPEQLIKRNASVWTDVQIILASVQFVIFLIGVTLNTIVARNLMVIDLYWISVALLFKTMFLALLFITGMFFVKELFDEWSLFEGVFLGGYRQHGRRLFPSALLRPRLAGRATGDAAPGGLPDLCAQRVAIPRQNLS